MLEMLPSSNRFVAELKLLMVFTLPTRVFWDAGRETSAGGLSSAGTRRATKTWEEKAFESVGM